MTIELRLQTLTIAGFRNITQLEFQLAPHINVISGDNGHGKTSALEALYFLATSRSFRAERIREICQEGAETTRVQGVFYEDGQIRRQRATIHQGRRSLAIDDNKPKTLSAYAIRTPVVVFHPGDLSLVNGGAATRRMLLDRVALYQDSSSGDARQRYQRAQRERMAVLETKGSRARELDAFEQLMAQHGAALSSARATAALALEGALLPAFSTMAASDLVLKVDYQPGGSADPEVFLARLQACRDQDRVRKRSTFGPQRDDLELQLNQRSARRHASQGQQRILTLALKAAELACVREARQTQPILLLDDVSSELDPTRTGSVYDFVRQTESQVLVTTTRPELFQTPGLSRTNRADFRLQEGALLAP